MLQSQQILFFVAFLPLLPNIDKSLKYIEDVGLNCAYKYFMLFSRSSLLLRCVNIFVSNHQPNRLIPSILNFVALSVNKPKDNVISISFFRLFCICLLVACCLYIVLGLPVSVDFIICAAHWVYVCKMIKPFWKKSEIYL